VTGSRLDAYLARIGLTNPPATNGAGLAMVQAAHRQSIPFENLGILLGQADDIGSDAVFERLVTQQRGGYCFAQNRLFADMLTLLDLPAQPLLARVWLNNQPGNIPPRTHTLLLVDLPGDGQWIADAGFGGTYVPPMPLVDGAASESTDGARHRLRRTSMLGDPEGKWLLERAGPHASTDGRAGRHGDWQPQYSFNLSRAAPVDLEQAHHWTATRPGTRFTMLQVVSRALPSGFASLTDGQLRVHEDGVTQVETISDPTRYRSVLAQTFGLDFNEAEIAALPMFKAAV
jgi:arylamine N-acetyltransferase